MRFSRIFVTGSIVASLIGTAVFAGSHITPEMAAAKARQSHMQLSAFNLGILGEMAKGTVEFDAAASQAAADNLAALATMNQTAYWKAGSSNFDIENTAALPEIWDNVPDVMAKAQGLAEAAVAMQASAGTLEGVQANIGAVGGACGACHKVYRQPNN